MEIIQQLDPQNAEKKGRTPSNTAEPPPEVVEILQQFGPRTKNSIGKWFAVPSLRPPLGRISREEMLSEGVVDAYSLLEPLLEKKILKRTLRTIDVLNGCGHQCDTCLADAALPTKIFSFDSLLELFSDPRFVEMLQPDSLRFGSSGDIMDHPQAINIIKLSLEKTVCLDKSRQGDGERHKIKIFTNYRPNHEKQLNDLFELAKQNAGRLIVVVSLPFNKTDNIHEKFFEFAKKRPDIFSVESDPRGFLAINNLFKEVKVRVNNIRHAKILLMTGRTLPKELYTSRDPDCNIVKGNMVLGYKSRGSAKTYLNPDSLWLMVYATPYESHTLRSFTPITEENIEVLSLIPYHSDFPTPPNWIGGRHEKKSDAKACQLREKAIKSGKTMRNPRTTKS